MATLAYIFNRTFTEISVQGLRYFGVVWTQTFGTFSHPLNITWMSLTCTDSEERALAMAMVIMGANIAGIYGAQIFRSDDKPRYRRAFIIGVVVLALGTILAVVRKADEIIHGRENPKAETGSEEVYDDPRHDESVPCSKTQPSPAVAEAGKKSVVSLATQ